MSEISSLKIPAGDLRKYDPSLNSQAHPPSVPLQTAVSWLRENEGIPSEEIVEKSLVHLPLYTFKYSYKEQVYTALVEAGTGGVFANIFPAKAEMPYRVVGGLTAAVFLCLATTPLIGAAFEPRPRRCAGLAGLPMPGSDCRAAIVCPGGTRGGKDMSEKEPVHGLGCPRCGGMVPIPEGQAIVRCPYCDLRSLVRGERGLRRYQVSQRVGREQAIQAMQGFLSGQRAIARDAASKGILTEAFLVYLPFWASWARVLGWIFGQKTRAQQRSHRVPAA